ncbi:hypothetical protein Mlute_00554 [Meiothermus luteus]|uniref:DUF721 domain-containing protein n=1 Tax=Meiothermus luteus TaxID=2026184 RepID=A0A399EXX9_9DEIN|nr:DUF721 domain-containing protein [Meiothermus luteus]RIH88593.1 hypothetical protein Mlute_00554 [Meiothermus luteus]
MSEARTAAEIIRKILEQSPLQAGLQRGRALLLWPQVVGPILSEMSQAERLEDGVLFVRVPDSVVAHQLAYLREEFLRRYQERLPGVVREVRFQVGAVFKQTQAENPPPPSIAPAEEAGLQALAERVPPALRQAVLRTGRAVLQRQKASPHPPCPVCGAASPEQPCAACQRLLAQPYVQREAGRLACFPLRPRLEGEPLEAARYLAQQRLLAQLQELLPEVVRNPELIAILQDTARRYLQLRTGQREVRPYRHLLPERVASLLKEI